MTLTGDGSVRQIMGEDFIDPGATVTDNLDNDIEVIVSGQVDTSKAGIYVLSYSATDTAGNEAVVINRNVFVENINPVVSVIGSTPVILEQDEDLRVRCWRRVGQVSLNSHSRLLLIFRECLGLLEFRFGIPWPTTR